MLFSLPLLQLLRSTGSGPRFTAVMCSKPPRRRGKGASKRGGKTSPIKSFETETRTTGALLTLLLITVFIGLGATSHKPISQITWLGWSTILRMEKCFIRAPTWPPKGHGGQYWPLICACWQLTLMDLVPTNGSSSLPTALSVCSPITVIEKAHSTTNRCLSMSAQGEEKIRTKLRNVGQLTRFTEISPESKRETSPSEERMRSPTRLV